MAWVALQCFSAVSADDAPLVLAQNGHSHTTIVVPSNCSAEVHQAAEILRDTLHEATGATFSIQKESSPVEGPRILIGPTKAAVWLESEKEIRNKLRQTGLRGECVVLRRVGQDLFILGNDAEWRHGTLDAVIRFLNHVVGADFYYPAPSGKVIPRHETLTIGSLDFIEQPDFPERGMSGSIRKDRNNILKEWRRWNHFAGSFEHRHAHKMIAPAAKYYAAHPEYYALVKGKRVPGRQLCTTHPRVIELATRRAQRLFKHRPDLLGASVSFSDGYGMCACSACRKLDAPDSLSRGARRAVTFANAVARKIPSNRYIAFYAYFFTLQPPMDMILEPNVIPVVADHEGCLFHSLNDPVCPKNQDAASRLQQWTTLSDTGVKVYEYHALNGDYMGLPYCNLQRVIENARFLKKLNGLGFYYSSRTLPAAQGLTNWTALRVLWDGELTVEGARKQYCDALYGPASEAMQAYYRHVERRCRQAGVHSVHCTWVVPGPLYLWTEEALTELEADLMSARRLLKTPMAQEAQRVNDQWIHLLFTRTFVDLKRAQRAYWKKKAPDNLARYRKLRKAYLALYERLDERGMLYLPPRVLETYAPPQPDRSAETHVLTPTPHPPSTDLFSYNDPAWTVHGFRTPPFRDEIAHWAYPKTRAHLTYDQKALYIRIHCNEYHMDDLKAVRDRKDRDLWGDDCVRATIILPNDSSYTFYVNAAGAVRDEKDSQVAWNGRWSARTDRRDKSEWRQWVAQLSIPWKTLGLRRPPDQVKVNLFRHVTTPSRQPLQAWATTFGDMNRTDYYPVLRLSSGDANRPMKIESGRENVD